MVNRISRKGVLAIAFLCLATYVVAFPGVAEAVDYQLTVNVVDPPNNYVTIDWGTGVNTCTAASCNFSIPDGSSVTLIPYPDGASHDQFDGWAGDIPAANMWDVPYVFTITADFTATANFVWDGQKFMVIDANGACSGAVHVIEDPPDHTAYVTSFPTTLSYWNARTVYLTAYPDPGCKFVKWAGDIASTNNPTPNLSLRSKY